MVIEIFSDSFKKLSIQNVFILFFSNLLPPNDQAESPLVHNQLRSRIEITLWPFSHRPHFYTTILLSAASGWITHSTRYESCTCFSDRTTVPTRLAMTINNSVAATMISYWAI